ncbi:hypothetical protein ACHAXA_004894 [Cyclostephanos tholiformis]|jgi:hypothetical protein|uniref:Uncharacterized protein n=1 Tax=Cyclostephanos tholiformis TaxID=382380 RepID=A0ABD3RSR7_9STRA
MTEASLDMTPPSKRIRGNSLGEELFLIHLRRTTAPDPHPEDAEDDHDYDKPRKPKKTIGEELFEVHLKRSKGLKPDYDFNPDAKISHAKPAADEAESKSESNARYNLRTRRNPSSANH